jgi:uncharacterized membrane protein
MQQHLAETRQRTAARAISYRVLAVISSFVMIGLISGVVIEITKTLIYYLLERAWLYVPWQISQGRESQTRIVARTVVYRVVATVAVAYWVGIESALWLALIQTILFYLNEIAWRRVSWGKTIATM